MPHVSLKVPVKQVPIQYDLFCSFDGKVFQSAGSTSYSHSSAVGMANYKGKALVTGCSGLDGSSTCYVKTELMDMNSLKWSNGPDYPFGS